MRSVGRTPGGLAVRHDGGGELVADRVVLATGTPVLDRGSFFARLEPQRSYCIAVAGTDQPPRGMYLSADSPTRSLRYAPTPDGDLLIVGGNGTPRSRRSDTAACRGSDRLDPSPLSRRRGHPYVVGPGLPLGRPVAGGRRIAPHRRSDPDRQRVRQVGYDERRRRRGRDRRANRRRAAAWAATFEPWALSPRTPKRPARSRTQRRRGGRDGEGMGGARRRIPLVLACGGRGQGPTRGSGSSSRVHGRRADPPGVGSVSPSRGPRPVERQRTQLGLSAARLPLRRGRPGPRRARHAGSECVGLRFRPTGYVRVMDQSRAPLLEALQEYHRLDRYGFSPPGHRQGRGADARVRDVLGDEPFRADVLASGGLDDRLSSAGYLSNAEKLMAEAVGADQAFFSTCGSSLSVKAAMMAVAGDDPAASSSLATLTSRSSPDWSSAASRPRWITPVGRGDAFLPSALPRAGPFRVGEAPRRGRSADRRPSPYGTCADIAGIADVCHERGKPLIVDEAWGAHLPFHEDLPTWAMDAGADVCVCQRPQDGSRFRTGLGLPRTGRPRRGPVPGAVRRPADDHQPERDAVLGHGRLAAADGRARPRPARTRAHTGRARPRADQRYRRSHRARGPPAG